MRERKLYIGQKIRQLREIHKLTQAEFAQRISISTSYLNQMENNQRHVTASVLLSLAEVFAIDIVSLSDNDSDRLLADLMEAMADPFFKDQMPSSRDLKQFTQITPTIARSFLNLHQALRRSDERMAEMDGTLERSGALNDPTPYEEVRDFFHYNNNYIDVLDRAAEELAAKLSHLTSDLHQSLVEYLEGSSPMSVVTTNDMQNADTLRHFSAESNTISISNLQPRSSQSFQLAHQIGQNEHGQEIAKIAAGANFKSSDAEAICKIGLANYFAGATILPYKKFLKYSRQTRYDLQIIARHFGASLEQVAHRLSTMQRAGEKGIPFFFARVDQAGNITKRHSATKLQFARFGSTCPLWNVHSSFASPGQILRQLAETPDGIKYLCLATEVTKSGLGYKDPVQRYAIALGCEIKHAGELVYADDLDVSSNGSFEPIGISCRICDRQNCHQRAVPPLKKDLQIDPDKRGIVPYSF